VDELARILGRKPDEDQQTVWKGMDPATRKRTARRLRAIMDWDDASQGLTAVAAAELAGVGISRFYKMAAEWRDTGSLEALGTVKGASGRRATKLDAATINALQSVVPKVVAQNDGVPVTGLVKLMVAAAGVRENLPGKMKLREIVETELRRREATARGGESVALDCCAISWARSQDRPYCVFVVLDRGTRCILGHHVGAFEEDLGGYASAVLDALDGIGDLPVDWSSSMRALQIVTGVDEPAYAELVDRLETEHAISAKRASIHRRFGRYLREIAGLRIDTIAFTPSRTASGGPVLVNGAPDVRDEDEVRSLVARAVAAYNSRVLAGHRRKGEPSRQLIDVLGVIAWMPD